jgi:hypothetical protein
MGVREKLNQSNLGIVAGAVLIFIAVGIGAYYLKPASRPNGAMDFYSDDDGQTYFEDSAVKFPPFDHNGNKAYEARVFKNTKGDKFVGILRRLTPDAKRKLEEEYADDVAKGHPEYIFTQQSAFDVSGMEIKVRGSSKWIPQGQDLTPDITAPDGDTVCVPVDP